MKKLLIAIILLIACPVWATNYYACGNANIDAASQWYSVTGCTGGTAYTYGTGGFPESGATLIANSYTVAINTDPGPNGTVTLTTTTNGGGFTLNTSVGGTHHFNCVAGTAHCLTLSGSTAGTPAITIVGNITGSATDSVYGCIDSHTGGTVSLTGNVYGGAAGSTSGYGYSLTGSGPVTISGDCNGDGAAGASNSMACKTSSGTVTVAGSCIAGHNSGSSHGCFSYSGAYFVVSGNIVNSAIEVGAAGKIRWTPTAPSSGVNGNYVKFDGGGTAVYVGKNTETQSKANTDFYYFISSSATSQAGTDAGTSGGGAWAY